MDRGFAIYQGAWSDVIRVAEESLPIAWRIGETSVILFASAWLGLACLKVVVYRTRFLGQS